MAGEGEGAAARARGGFHAGAGAASPDEEGASLFDGYGESAFLDAKRLVRAGELASRSNKDDDFESFGALFRAIAHQLEIVGRWVESGRREVLALRAPPARSPSTEPRGEGGS